MTIKPFAIQGADLTLGGVNLQAGTTGVVIPGVTRATSYVPEEVNDTNDQTHSFTTIPVVIDYTQYSILKGDYSPSGYTEAEYVVNDLDGEGYIDGIDIVSAGSGWDSVSANGAQNNDMKAYVGTEQNPFASFVYTDWISIPFRVKIRAGEIETIGGAGSGLVQRTVNYPLGESGDTAGTMALTPSGNVYVCTADFVEPQQDEFTVFHTTANLGQPGVDAGYQPLTIDFSDSRNADFADFIVNPPYLFDAYVEISFDGFDTVTTAHSYGGNWSNNSSGYQQYSFNGTTLNDGAEVWIRISSRVSNIWTQSNLGQLQVLDGKWITNTRYQGGEGSLYIENDNVDLYVDNNDNSIAEVWLHNNDTSAPHVDINVAAANNNDPTATKTWKFNADGSITFPDNTVQTTAYTGQSTGGGSGELYIMANVDGNIVTSTDGVTWGEPVASGVPTSGGGPFPIAIGKLAVHGGVIVYTRTDEGNGDGIRGSGLYYSTEIGTATLCVGTDADPGGDLYWNEVHFFPETDKWVAVGYWQYQQDSRKPIFAYSTDGISWTVKYVDSGFVSDHNIGNWSWEMTDVAYNPTDAVYVFVGKVGGSNYAGAFVTNNLDATFDASIWVDVPGMNLRSIVSWPATGIPVTGYMLGVNSGTVTDVWATWSPVSDANNWSASFSGPNSGWYQDAMINAVGYVPNISEITANGNSLIITTADGQVAVPTFGPMIVEIPLAYTSAINDISRTNGTIDTFDVSPIIGFQNNNWTTFDQVVNSGDDSFHIVIDGTGTLITCDLDTSTIKHNIGDVITLYGATFGGTSGIDDIVITVTGTHHPITTITFTGEGIANNSGEKIVISGVTSHTENGTTTEQSYNGTYYVKRIDNGGDPATYELYTDQTCTTPWDTSTYWPVNLNTGTLTWSHGQFIDAAGCSNSYYYIGNDDEQIFRSIDGGFTWVEQTDVDGAYFNDFAYGTWGSGASSSGTVTIESPFVTDFFGPEVYFVKTNYGSEVDNIDTNVAITRGDHQGIYNPITNPDWNDNTNGPTNTEWNSEGWGDLSNVKDRYYSNWESIMNGGIRAQGRELVMHDTINDKYYTIKFLTFQGSESGGAFSYVRRLINTACWFNRADGDDSESVVDAVGPGLTIARGSSQGIYNSADEGGWNDNVSPTGTLWNADGWDDLTNITTRQYLNFYSLGKHQIGKAICGREYVMKDTINNKYYAIKFTYWSNSGNSWPGVRYTRREIDLTKVSHNVKFADGSIQTTAVTEQRLGVLPQKIVDNNYDRYLTPDDIGKHLFVTVSGTYIYITDSNVQNFPVGSVITIINMSGGTIYIRKDNDNENGTIYGANQNANGTSWYMDDSGSGNMITLIKIGEFCDDGLYSRWMIAGSGIGLD